VTDIEIGTRIREYRIESLLGRGGQGVVYLAEHTALGRKVALKVLPAAMAQDAEFRQRFVREARLAAMLEHPNILPVYDAGEEDGRLFLAVRLVSGSDLAAILRTEGPLEAERALALLGAAASGLDAAHANGLVHRDVKPGNLLIERRTDGQEHLYISDFGLTKATVSGQDLLGSGPITKSGYFVGTPEYAAPEQIESKEVDGRTDQYSLGCVLYQTLTGRLPFAKDSLGSALVAHMIEPPPRVTAVRPDLPGALDHVVARSMAKRKDQRYASCSEMIAAARSALGAAGASIPAPPPPVASLRPMPPAPHLPASAPPEVTRVAAHPVAAPPPAPPQGSPVPPLVAPMSPRPPTPTARTRRRSRRGVVVGLVLLLVLGGGAAAFLTLGGSGGGCQAQTYSSGGAHVDLALDAAASVAQQQQAPQLDSFDLQAAPGNARSAGCSIRLAFTRDGRAVSSTRDVALLSVDATTAEPTTLRASAGDTMAVRVHGNQLAFDALGGSRPGDDCALTFTEISSSAIRGTVECANLPDQVSGDRGSFTAQFEATA
jgi:serine/threonine protein kinase